MGPAGMAEIQYYVQGPDIKKLDEYSNKLMELAKDIPGLTDLDRSLRSGKPELLLDIDRRGLPTSESPCKIFSRRSTRLSLDNGKHLQFRRRSIRRCRAAEDRFRGSVEGLEKLTVASAKRGSVGLNEVVRNRRGAGPSSIERLNRQRIVEVSGNLLPGGSQGAVVNSFNRFMDELDMEPDYTGGATGMTER